MSEEQPVVGEGVEALSGTYLTFELADEAYGVEILKVQEIIGLLPITRVPRTPDFILGVINLRGRIIPIMDLRLKFGMPPSEPTPETCIIVLHIDGVQTGVVVDRVSDVRTIEGSDVEAVPSFGSEIDTAYLLGIAKAEETVTLLLDIERVLTRDEVEELHTVQADAGTTTGAETELAGREAD